MKMSRFRDTTRENSARSYIKNLIPVYQKFRYFRGQYDTIYRQRNGIFAISKHHLDIINTKMQQNPNSLATQKPKQKPKTLHNEKQVRR